jgi:MYXO-CTERM domain-containing protein
MAGAVAALPAVAGAADTWTTPHPGMRMLTRTQSGPNWRIWALEIDLCASGVSVRATKSNERQRTVSSFAGLLGAQAAVNGDFFSYATYATSGLSVGAGEPWPDTADANGYGYVVFGNDRAELELPGTQLAAADGWMQQLVSGRRRLVDQGVPMSPDGSELCELRHPRTAAGLSKDGRTLYLAVVDGRTTISVGMTCPELGTLMAELGAWSAINLDGGGSTTMWVSGQGVVNSPSDGSQRVVANHLGILATGSGDPGSCDRSYEESAVHGDAYDASTTTDIDGDGDADVCVRTSTGVECALGSAGSLVATVAGPALSDDSGWSDASNWSTLRMGDLDGDGRADLCARANAGIRCWRSLGDAFEATAIEGPALADDVGWAAPAYHGTLRMADVDGDGRDDLCVRSASDFRCYPSLGAAGFADPWTLPDLGDDQGFDEPSRYGTIRMADVDGDARVDLCARAAEGMRCWPSTGAGFGPPLEGPAWSDAAGWRRPEYWSTIRLVDVDGDARADLCARAAAGLRCHLSSGSGFGGEVAGPAWTDASGWGDYDNYSTIRFADIDGDGDADVCARANAGIRCHAWTGEGFAEDAIVGPELSDASGFGNIRFYSTIRLADVDGDGAADLCARAAAGLRCWPSQGDGFGEPWLGPAWSDDAGFGQPALYETLRAARPMRRCVVEESCNGLDDDCDGMIDEGCPANDGGLDDSGSGGAGTGSAGTGTAGSDETGAHDPALPHGFGQDGDGGCACTAEPSGRSPAALVVLLGLLWLTTRRRR